MRPTNRFCRGVLDEEAEARAYRIGGQRSVPGHGFDWQQNRQRNVIPTVGLLLGTGWQFHRHSKFLRQLAPRVPRRRKRDGARAVDEGSSRLPRHRHRFQAWFRLSGLRWRSDGGGDPARV